MKMNKTGIIVLMAIGIVSCARFTEPTMNAEKILKELSVSSEGKTEVVKQFPENFPEVLVERGTPTVYTRHNSNNFEYIGMPVGGIGTGTLYLGGDGQLWFWDIFNLNYRYGHLKGEEAYEFPYERSKAPEQGTRKVDQGFAISVITSDTVIRKTLNRDGFEDIEFIGQYPVSEVRYRSADIPLSVKLEAFSPFIPHDIKNSMLPATVFSYTVKNTSKRAVEIELSGWLENAVLIDSRKNNDLTQGIKLQNEVVQHDKYLQLQCNIDYDEGIADSLHKLPDFGSMTLSVLGDERSFFSHTDEIVSLPSDEPLTGTIGQKLTLASGEEKTVNFVLSWYFPNVRMFYNKWRNYKTQREIMYQFKNQYALMYTDAADVADYLIGNFDNLSATTQLWRDTWYNSTLPYWFLDRTFVNTSTLASCTSRILEGWRFYGWEGSYQGEGTCNHVWGYVQTLARLFPELEKKLRTNVELVPVEEGGAMNPDGDIRFRWLSEYGMAVDGQSGVILRSYLAHQHSVDNNFLIEAYPGLKKAMQGLTKINDPDEDGILTGPQHNTLDAAWHGKVTWLSLYYTTALRAMSEMAAEVGDSSYAEFCVVTADKGRRYIEEQLFNGEYFIHEADSLHPESPGTYTGLEYSQLMGQSWAYQVGLGSVIDSAMARKALESMWRYNFTTDVDTFRKVHPTGRWYAMPGEGGLIACTWPRGGSEVLAKGNPRFAAYNNECQNGYEYAASSLMMRHGMPYHALTHIWYMDQNRYHGSKRNPYSEIEWGLHYARSMASYGHFTAVSGFEYHGPKGYISFAPQITPQHFKCAFTAAEGWGSFEQKQAARKQTNSISIAYGQLALRTIVLTPKTNRVCQKLSVWLNDDKVACSYTQKGAEVHIQLAKGIEMTANDNLKIIMQ